MANTSDSRWFRILSFLITGIFAGVFLANIVYYSKLTRCDITTGCNIAVSKGEARSMLYINIIFFIVALILFIWSLIRLFVHPQHTQLVTAYLQQPAGIARAPTPPAALVTPVVVAPAPVAAAPIKVAPVAVAPTSLTTVANTAGSGYMRYRG